MHPRHLRRGRLLALGGAGLLLSATASAQLALSVAADSDYRYRGVSLSDSKPSLRATLDYDAPRGWYAGVSAAGVVPAPGERRVQWLVYAGRVMRLDDTRQLEFGASNSHFGGDSSYDFAEAYAGLLGEHWSARLHYAPNYFGRNVQTLYAELDAHWLLGTQARLFGHAGVLVPLAHTDDAASGRTRADLRVGSGLTVNDWDLQLAWVAATRDGPYPAVYSGRRTAWVASASYAF